MSGDVLRLLHGCHHIPVHGLEGRVVGAVREEEDAGHLDGGVALHLLEQGLQVDALGGPEVQLCHWTRCLLYVEVKKPTFFYSFFKTSDYGGLISHKWGTFIIFCIIQNLFVEKGVRTVLTEDLIHLVIMVGSNILKKQCFFVVLSF